MGSERNKDLHVLERPLDVYDRFDRTDSGRLRAYVVAARRLGGMSFFDQVPTTVTMQIGAGEGLQHKMDEPDDESIRAAVTQIRQLYTNTERTSFRATFKLLKRSVRRRASPEQAAALDALSAHTQSLSQLLENGMNVGFVLESPVDRKVMDAKAIIDAYFHGHYLHSGNQKAELVRSLDEIGPLARFEFYGLLFRMNGVFWRGANVVDLVLDYPQLITE